MNARISMICRFFVISALASCVYIPTAPTITVKPGTGKSIEQFLADNDICRKYSESEARNLAYGLTSGPTANAGAENGTGKIADDSSPEMNTSGGRIEGESAVRYGADKIQRRYDISYAHCMYHKGNIVPAIG